MNLPSLPIPDGRRQIWRRLALVLLGPLIALLAGCAAPRPNSTPTGTEPRLALGGILQSGTLPGFVLTQTNQGRSSSLFTFTNAEFVVKLEVFAGVPAETAQVLVEEGIMSLRALYADALSPYPGDISNRIVSNRTFQPDYREKVLGGIRHRYFLLHANDRMGYGATTADAVRFRSLLGWIYCPSEENLYKVRCYAPPTTSGSVLENWFLSLRCR